MPSASPPAASTAGATAASRRHASPPARAQGLFDDCDARVVARAGQSCRQPGPTVPSPMYGRRRRGSWPPSPGCRSSIPSRLVITVHSFAHGTDERPLGVGCCGRPCCARAGSRRRLQSGNRLGLHDSPLVHHRTNEPRSRILFYSMRSSPLSVGPGLRQSNRTTTGGAAARRRRTPAPGPWRSTTRSAAGAHARLRRERPGLDPGSPPVDRLDPRALVQGNVVRDYVKWDDQPHDANRFPARCARADPDPTGTCYGPVHLALTQGLQEDEVGGGFRLGRDGSSSRALGSRPYCGRCASDGGDVCAKPSVRSS